MKVFLLMCCMAKQQAFAVQHYLLSCPFKKLSGLDCPGCGFQRSAIALIQGDFTRSFHLYPATVPLLVLFAAALLFRFFPTRPNRVLLSVMLGLCSAIILGAYALKIAHGGLR